MVLAAPAMAPLIFALCILLILWGARALFAPLQAVFRAIPFIGTQLANAIGDLIARAGQFVADLLDAEFQAIINMIDWLAGNVTLAIRGATAAATWLGITLRAVLAQAIATLIFLQLRVGQLQVSLAALAASAAATVARVASIAATVARILATTIPAAVAAGVALAVARAGAALTAAQAALTAALAATAANLLRAVGAETAARAAADLAVRSWAAAALAAQAATAAVNLAHAQAWAAAQVGQLGQAIDGVQAKIGPIAYPTVAIAIGTLVGELTTMRRQCVDPTCNYLGPQLRALELAGDLAMLAAVGALIAEAARDPERAADDTIATARPFVSGAAGLLGEVTGLGF